MYGLQHSVVYYVETEIFLHNTTDLEGGKVHKRFAAEVQEIFARSSLSELANSTNGTHADTLLPEEKNHEILFSFGVASALLILLLQAAVSKYHTHHLVPAKIRLAVRGIVALVIGLLPLGTFGIGGLVLLVVVAALVLLLALFEIVSILPGHHEEEDHIENLKQKPIEEVRSFVQRAYSSRLLMVQKPEVTLSFQVLYWPYFVDFILARMKRQMRRESTRRRTMRPTQPQSSSSPPPPTSPRNSFRLNHIS